MKKAISAAIVTGVSVIALAAPVSAAVNPKSQVANSDGRNTAGPHCHINLKSDALTGASHNAHLTIGNGVIFVADLDCNGVAG